MIELAPDNLEFEDTVWITGKPYPKGVTLRTHKEEFAKEAKEQGCYVFTEELQFGKSRPFINWVIHT